MSEARILTEQHEAEYQAFERAQETKKGARVAVSEYRNKLQVKLEIQRREAERKRLNAAVTKEESDHLRSDRSFLSDIESRPVEYRYWFDFEFPFIHREKVASKNELMHRVIR
jgi:hypothetical protein